LVEQAAKGNPFVIAIAGKPLVKVIPQAISKKGYPTKHLSEN